MAEDSAPDVETQHKFLDLAKEFQWDEVKRLVEATPELVAVQPLGRGGDGSKRWSALHQAAYNGNTNAVQFLLDHKADPAATTHQGQTPLEVAKGKAVKALLKSLGGGEAAEAAAADEAADEEDEEEEEEEAEEEEAAEEKAAEDDAEVAEPAPKKAKKSKPASVGVGLNLNLFLKKSAEAYSLADIADQPVSVLQGLGEVALKALHHRGVKTVRQLATWKFYRICRGIVVLRGAEEPGARDPSTEMNINKALDKKWETKSLDEIVNAPISALEGLTPKDDEHFGKIHVKTIADLGTWKFARWAEAIVDLAPFESSIGTH